MNYSNNLLEDETKGPADNTLRFFKTKVFKIKIFALPDSELIS